MKKAVIAIMMAMVFITVGNSLAQGVVKMPESNEVELDIKPGLVKQNLWLKFVEAYGPDCSAWPPIIRVCDMYTRMGVAVDTFAGWNAKGEVFMLGKMHDVEKPQIFNAISNNKLLPGEVLEVAACGAYHVIRKEMPMTLSGGVQSSTTLTTGENVGWRLEEQTHPDTQQKIKIFVGPKGPVNGEAALANPDVRRLAGGKEIKTFTTFSAARNETVVVPYITAE